MKSRYPSGSVNRPKHNSTPLSQTRYEDLMRQMGQVFTQAEEGATTAKQQAIADIHEMLSSHGLSVEDLECDYL
jgi:hypothetical protein